MFLKINNQKIEIKIARTFKEKLYGLMGKTNFNYGMLFDNCNAIHTYFMKENIDIIGLDNENRVIYKYENLPKNQIIKINHPLHETSILELPQGLGKEIIMNEKIKFDG